MNAEQDAALRRYVIAHLEYRVALAQRDEAARQMAREAAAAIACLKRLPLETLDFAGAETRVRVRLDADRRSIVIETL